MKPMGHVAPPPRPGPSANYTLDVVYPSAFGAFQAPAHLAQAAWMAGRAGPPPDGAFTYADLGCGAGLTLCLLAECYPQAEFHGIDLNPEHVSRARALARSAGLRNVTVHEASFADLDELALPRLDFAALSGVYSWLQPGLRAACLAFLGRRLTPQGVVFLHYAALPGNAQTDALYALLREAARGLPGDSVARFRQACATLQRLREAGARFFKVNPYADAWFEKMGEQDPAAIAHEVLNAQAHSLSAADVAAEAEPHGLAFVANAQLELNDLELSAPDALRELLGQGGRTGREMMLDALRNAHSRMDVLMRAGGEVAAAPPRLWVDRLTRGPLDAERRRLSAQTGIDLMAPAYGRILERVDGAAVPLPDLLAALGAGATDLHVQRLATLKLVNLLCRPYAAEAPGGRPRMASRVNALVLEDRIESSGPVPFCSPVAGNQVLLPPQDRLALLWLLGGDFGAAWRRLAAMGQTARINGRTIDSAEALATAARLRAEAIGPSMLRALARLGVIA